MKRTLPTSFLALLAAGALVACSGYRSGLNQQPQSMQLPMIDGDLAITATFPKDAIGAGYPDQIGHYFSKFWKADIAGFTQTGRSQILGFPPGTKITIKNISTGSEEHTLNVIKKISGPPADFPKNPNLLFTPSGGTKLVVGYRSGILKPGHSVTVTLVEGTFLIGCAFHYSSDNMRDVLVVRVGAKPGPSATP